MPMPDVSTGSYDIQTYSQNDPLILPPLLAIAIICGSYFIYQFYGDIYGGLKNFRNYIPRKNVGRENPKK